jgi:pimeloyl-ACP methyl ester carboxylesterase
MPWIEVGQTDIYYHEEGQGQPLVFLHGNGSCGEGWWQQFAHFRDRFRCIAYDSVNHGHSSNSPRDADEPDRADELEGFLAAMKIQRPVLAGNSMGGNTLLRWATRHPSAALALIPSGMGVAAAPPAGGGPAAAPPLDPSIIFLPTGNSFTEEFKKTQPRMYERYLRIRSTATRIEAQRNPRRPAARTTAERGGMSEAVKMIASPMAIIFGSLDALVPPANGENLHRLVPHSEYHVIDGAPHNVYYEASDRYNAIVDAFLAKVAAPAGAR